MTNYTHEEKSRVVDYLIALRKDLLRAFMRQHELRLTGTKEELRSGIETGLADGTVRFADIVEYLDHHEPWSKQHIYLLDGPEGGVSQWRQLQFVREVLSRHNLDPFFAGRSAANES